MSCFAHCNVPSLEMKEEKKLEISKNVLNYSTFTVNGKVANMSVFGL